MDGAKTWRFNVARHETFMMKGLMEALPWMEHFYFLPHQMGECQQAHSPWNALMTITRN